MNREECVMVSKAIFGGTFDPIHNGHMHIAYEALYRLRLDKVIFMPSGNPPHKLGKKLTDASLRYEMVKTAIKQEPCFEISDYEITKNALSYTYQTLQHFKNIEKNTVWYFLTGVDCLMDINQWKNTDEIFKLATLIVFNRPGYNIEDIKKQKSEIENKYSNKIIFLDIPLLDISSTNIRSSVKEDKNVSYLLPENVYSMINKFGMYKDKI